MSRISESAATPFSRSLALIEPFTFFGLIMAYIWSFRYTETSVWVLILGLMPLSHVLRRERPAGLGFQTGNLRECAGKYAPALLGIAIFLLAGGIFCATIRPLRFSQGLLALGLYLPWGILQQYILNGYFLNRFEALLPRRTAPVLSAALFAGVHTPNWFLMIVCLLAGYLAAHVYRRDKNLYFLGLAHGAVGFLLFLVVPDSVSHHLNVGPGWYAH